MSVHPKNLQDLSLAPISLELDNNLKVLRDKSVDKLVYEFALELDRRSAHANQAGRIQMVIDAATRNVNLHGWEVAVTDDMTRLRLTGGSVSLDLGLSASLTEYIEHGESPDAEK